MNKHTTPTAPPDRDAMGRLIGEASILIDFKQATDLLAMFGGEPNEITLSIGAGHSGRGLYAGYTDMPEEGTIFLGVSDQEAMPDEVAQQSASTKGADLPRGALTTLRTVVAMLRENGRFEDEEGEPTDALEDLRDWLDAHVATPAPSPLAETGEALVDMTPPATARDRWMYQQGRLAERDPRTHRAELIEELCARIKAADDVAADDDYMLDSNDCIAVLRGTWGESSAAQPADGKGEKL